MSFPVSICADCEQQFIPALRRQMVCEPCREEAYQRTLPHVVNAVRKTFPNAALVKLFEEIESVTSFSEEVLGAWNRMEMEAANG